MPLLSTAAAAALSVLFFLSPFAHAPAWAAGRDAQRESAREVEAAEKIIDKLRLLEAGAGARKDSGAFNSAVAKLYPGLFAEVAALREGDIKSDLSTAVFFYHDAHRLYYEAHRARPTSASPAADCDREPRAVYRKLCRETDGGTRAAFMCAKARLHTGWAVAAVAHARGRRDAATLTSLAETRAERAVDAALARRVLDTLRALEKDVNARRTLAEFEERGPVANVSFARLSESVSETLRAVDPTLASLPRGPVRLALQNARNSYRDGLFWWQKTHRRAELTVPAGALAETDPLDATRLDASAAAYTVVVNWRNALRYTAQAESLLGPSPVEHVASHPQP